MESIRLSPGEADGRRDRHAHDFAPAHTHLAFEGFQFAKEHSKDNEYNHRVLRAFFQEGQDIGSIDVLTRLAGEVGLDEEQFRKALSMRTYREAHQRALQHAYGEAGITGVPAFFIGDLMLVGMQSKEALEAAIAEEMEVAMQKKPATKTSVKKLSKPAKLPPLTGIQQHVMAYVMNSIVFENYGECCSTEGIAEHFKRTPGRFMPTLRKLVEKGYVTISGETFPWVYPTVEALRNQDKELSGAEAKKILKKIGGTRRRGLGASRAAG